MIPIISGIIGLAGTIINGIKEHVESKQKLKRAKVEARIKRIQTQQNFDHEWEMKQLDQAGWKDDILFYAFIIMFIYAGFYPDKAKDFFENLRVLPDWFVKTWMWIVASVVGVKKIGDYLPGTIKAIKEVWKK